MFDFKSKSDGQDLDLADSQSGPTAMSRTSILKSALEEFPDAKEPDVSRINQANSPHKTDFRTPSGARSYTQCWRQYTQIPQPKRKPPVRADKNMVVESV